MARAEARFSMALKESASAPRLEDIRLEAPRLMAPASLPFCTSEHYDRAAHTYGKSYPELARGLDRDYGNAPDPKWRERHSGKLGRGSSERAR